jgi:hypothetical protein
MPGKEAVTMNTIRQWSFPFAILLSWVVISAYTLSALSEMPRPREAHAGSSNYRAPAGL